jgi:uncharacterized protein YcaQ
MLTSSYDSMRASRSLARRSIELVVPVTAQGGWGCIRLRLSPSLDTVSVHELSRTEARRVAVRAQLLDSSRPAGLLDVVRRLTLLQSDSTAAVAPSADLVAGSRLGASYSPAELSDALHGRALIELRGMIRPAEDVVLYRAEMAEWPGSGEVAGWRKARAE